MVREYALLSIIFSDVLTFHIKKTGYQLVMPLIKAIYEVAICLFSKMNPRMYVISPLCSKPDSRNLDASVNQTLLLFVVSESPAGNGYHGILVSSDCAGLRNLLAGQKEK